LPQETKYFASIDGQQAGPFDRAKLHDAVAQGKLTRETMVWAKGMPQWTAAAQVPALSSLFDDVPRRCRRRDSGSRYGGGVGVPERRPRCGDVRSTFIDDGRELALVSLDRHPRHVHSDRASALPRWPK